MVALGRCLVCGVTHGQNDTNCLLPLPREVPAVYPIYGNVQAGLALDEALARAQACYPRTLEYLA